LDDFFEFPTVSVATTSNALFANDPFPVMSAAANIIGTSDKWPRFDLISPLTQVVTGALTKKVTIESVLSQVSDQFTPLAQAQGYEVVNK
jgi:hypothetical protein